MKTLSFFSMCALVLVAFNAYAIPDPNDPIYLLSQPKTAYVGQSMTVPLTTTQLTSGHYYNVMCELHINMLAPKTPCSITEQGPVGSFSFMNFQPIGNITFTIRQLNRIEVRLVDPSKNGSLVITPKSDLNNHIVFELTQCVAFPIVTL